MLPGVNGITKLEYLSMIDALALEKVFVRTTPILEKFRIAGRVGAIFNQALCALPIVDEAFGHNLVTVLRKPKAILHSNA